METSISRMRAEISANLQARSGLYAELQARVVKVEIEGLEKRRHYREIVHGAFNRAFRPASEALGLCEKAQYVYWQRIRQRTAEIKEGRGIFGGQSIFDRDSALNSLRQAVLEGGMLLSIGDALGHLEDEMVRAAGAPAAASLLAAISVTRGAIQAAHCGRSQRDHKSAWAASERIDKGLDRVIEEAIKVIEETGYRLVLRRQRAAASAGQEGRAGANDGSPARRRHRSSRSDRRAPTPPASRIRWTGTG